MKKRQAGQGYLRLKPTEHLTTKHALDTIDERYRFRPELVHDDGVQVTIRLHHDELDRLAGVRR